MIDLKDMITTITNIVCLGPICLIIGAGILLILNSIFLAIKHPRK